MASNKEYPPEVAAIVSTIESWLDKNNSKIDIDLSKDPIEFEQVTSTLFTGTKPQVRITIGFTDENLTKNASIDQLRSGLNFVALDRLPLPGLSGIPPQWELRPQTPMSSFSEGITLEQYDPNTQILKLNIKTEFFAIYGQIPQEHKIADRSLPKGTYLQVRRDIQGTIKVAVKLVFSK
jgi:hypothetical protein